MDPKLAQSLLAGGPAPSGSTIPTNGPATAMDPSLARSLLANGGPASPTAPPVNTRPSLNNTHSAAVNPNSGLSRSPQYARDAQVGQMPEYHGSFASRPPHPNVHPMYVPNPWTLDSLTLGPLYCHRCSPCGIACRCKPPAVTVGSSCCTIL
jgi:hypothetical protein